MRQGCKQDYDATTLDAGATAVGGLTTGTTYYAIRVDKDNLLKLASSEANANAGSCNIIIKSRIRRSVLYR